jgi:hypothetical protein
LSGGNSIRALLTGLALVAAAANATEWVEVGADTEARYYVDVDSISVDGDNVSVQKRGVYTHVLTDDFGGHPTTFKETIGTIELDCARRINRVTRIDMIGEDGEVVWSSGPLKKRMWEEIRPNSHAQSTLEVVCGRLKRT